MSVEKEHSICAKRLGNCNVLIIINKAWREADDKALSFAIKSLLAKC